MHIRAAVLRDPAAPYAIEPVEIAEPRDDEVLVKIAGTGMCHTDILARAPAPASRTPIITGHEGAGVVEAIGSDVTGVAVGDHVVLSFDSCGQCRNCVRGLVAYCDTFIPRNLLGGSLDGAARVVGADGRAIASRWFGQSSFATHALATARNVVVVDPDLPLELLGPLGCGIQTGAGSVLHALDVQPGSSVVISGAGAVGLAAVMAAVIAQAQVIVAIDVHQHRLELAFELGATHVISGDGEAVLQRLQEITDGGADYSLDTTGVPSVMSTAIACLRMAGRCGFVGIQTGDLVLDPVSIIGKTVTSIIEGGVVPQQFIPRLIDLWREGHFPFDRLLQSFPLEEINVAEQASLTGRVVKPVLVP